MSYDRRWLEEAGSEDSHARAVWALGAVARPGRRTGAPRLGASACSSDQSSRWRISLRRAPGPSRSWDRRISHGRPEDLRFVALAHASWPSGCDEHLRRNRRPGWTWFEESCPTTMPGLAQAWSLPGVRPAPGLARRMGWGPGLAVRHAADRGRAFPPDRLGRLLAARRRACGIRPAAARSGGDGRRLPGGVARDAQPALAGRRRAAPQTWFLGANDLGLPLHDPATGGCQDGLLCDRVNENQGAESTLAFLIAMVEMHLVTGAEELFDPKRIEVTIKRGCQDKFSDPAANSRNFAVQARLMLRRASAARPVWSEWPRRT